MSGKALSSKHIIEYGDIKILKSGHPQIRRLKRDGYVPEIHGTKVWRSAFVMMDYFDENPLPKKKKVMDVGCGWGIMGLYLSQKFNSRVISVDADANLQPYVELHGIYNDCKTDFRCQRFNQLKRKELEGVHTLVGTDICFWDELTEQLFALVRRAVKHGVENILIADPGRPPFWALTEKCEKRFDAVVHERKITHPIKTTKYILTVRQ